MKYLGVPWFHLCCVAFEVMLCNAMFASNCLAMMTSPPSVINDETILIIGLKRMKMN